LRLNVSDYCIYQADMMSVVAQVQETRAQLKHHLVQTEGPVPEAKIGEKMHDLCLMLNMTGWMHRKCSLLTAEKRHKLKIALALVAYNKILVLDEPTCGMPATTRREIWNILRYIRYCGKTIIFATNDELECKILADFIILFQDSEMLAIGSLQYLRYKYSHGFYLEVRLIRDGATLAESEEKWVLHSFVPWFMDNNNNIMHFFLHQFA